MAKCTAHSKRTGEPCRNNAVKGYRVCRMHGAGSPHKGRPGGRPIVHGAYSKAVREQEIPTLEELRALGVGLESEVALARLQLHRALEWVGKQCDGKRCPQEVVDRRLDLVSKVAERCKRVADGIQVRIVDEAGVDRIVEVIERHVRDPQIMKAIATDLEMFGRGQASADESAG